MNMIASSTIQCSITAHNPALKYFSLYSSGQLQSLQIFGQESDFQLLMGGIVSTMEMTLTCQWASPYWRLFNEEKQQKDGVW